MSKKPFQDIFTPRVMVEELIEHCEIKDGDTILEPCVGDGNLIIPIFEKYSVDIDCVEIQQKHIVTLKERMKDIKNTEIIDKIEESDTFDDFF